MGSGYIGVHHQYLVREHKISVPADCNEVKPTGGNGKTEKTPITKDRRMCVILSVAVIVSVLATLTSVSVIVVYSYGVGRGTSPLVYRNNRLCVSCAMVNSDNPVIVGVERQPLCCFDDKGGTNVQYVLDMIKLEDSRDTRENSFHVYYREDMSPDVPPVDVVTPSKLRTWATKGKRAHIGKEIVFNQTSGLFTVSAAGNYMVYSHLAFQPPPHILEEKKVKGQDTTFVFSHSVQINSLGDEEVVMEDSAEATCVIRHQYGGQLYPCHVSSLVGVIPLDKGDQIGVAASPKQYLLGDLKSSYFGVFLIG